MGNGILILQRGAEVRAPEVGKLLIPTMTSNDAPSGVASTSTGSGIAYVCFNQNATASWGMHSGESPSSSDFVKYTFAKPVKKITEWICLAGTQGGTTTCAIYAIFADGTQTQLGQFTETSVEKIFRGTCDVKGEIVAVKVSPWSFGSDKQFYIHYLNVVGVE